MTAVTGRLVIKHIRGKFDRIVSKRLKRVGGGICAAD